MSKKSNREICDFFMEKKRDELTLKYFKTWKTGKNPKNNQYLGLYEDFKSFSEDLKNLETSDNKDNVSLYRVLQAWGKVPSWKDLPAWKEWEETSFPIEIYSAKNKKPIYLGKIADASQMPNLDFLENIDIDILNPAKNPGGVANQKWHLYVSYFAYSVVCNNNFDWNKSSIGTIKCTLLRLWMIENAEGQEAALKEIEKVIDQDGNIKPLIKIAFQNILNGTGI